MWLDGLVTNVDRTPRNANLLVWHQRLWLIDHGAALYQHHRGLDPAVHAERPFPQIREHVLLGCAGSILEAHARLAPRVDPSLLEQVVALVPDEWLAGQDPAVYVQYLSRRVGWRGVEEPGADVPGVGAVQVLDEGQGLLPGAAGPVLVAGGLLAFGAYSLAAARYAEI